jgi:hypothetical protein
MENADQIAELITPGKSIPAFNGDEAGLSLGDFHTQI